MSRHSLLNRDSRRRPAGFTIIEVLIASLIMAVILVGALSIYVKSNKTASDQQQYVQIQQDVRAAMYYVSRDARMAGAGLPSNFYQAALQGTDNENQGGAVQPDRLQIMGNIEEPFGATIQSYNGSSANVTLSDQSYEQFPYPDAYYVGKIILILPKPGSTCWGAAVRSISHVTHNPGGTNEGLNFSPGQAPGINPPGGLSDVCPDTEFTGGTVISCDLYEYWLDVTGNYSGLTAGTNGYIGGGTGGVLYQTRNGVHSPIAMNIEDLQIQYNGNFDGDSSGTLDGFTDWNSAWTATQIAGIRQVRIWVVGKTPGRFTSISAAPQASGSIFRHPAVANSPAGTTDDWCKRFVLETTSNIRNLSLSLYNTGVR
jgi:prepilin-type N-terminal cleavage/methylation domain-containing protein